MARNAQSWSLRVWAIHLVRTELRLLLGLTAVSVFLWVFLSVMGEVREGDTYELDRSILLALRRTDQLGVPIGPRWLQETARDVTALGGFSILTLVVGLSVALLLLHRRRFQAAVFAVAVVAGQVLAAVTKHLVGRDRPDLVPHLDQVYSASFPSGHSAMSPIVYFTLAGILAAGEPNRAAKTLLLGVAAVLVLGIGASRVYLGVHWPTDVLAGWAMGAAVALVATLVLHRLAPHRVRVGARPGEPPVAPHPQATGTSAPAAAGTSRRTARSSTAGRPPR
jgi:undecaprenyl-diphosphatase